MGHLSTVVVALLGTFAICHAAPAAILQPATQYYLIQPQPATLKIQPHLIQPIQQLKLEPKQYVYYYPSLPLATTTTTTHQYTEGKPIRLVTLKQDEGNWWSSVFSFLQPPSTEMPTSEGEMTEAPPAGEEGGAAKAPEKKLMFMAPADAEKGPETPASTAALPQPQRYYILSGAPQFYGNFDALQNPLSPVFSLQPLQAIHARANSDIQAEDGLQPKFQAQIVSSLAPIAPVPAAVPAQLKNDLLESHQDKEQTIDRAWARSLDDEQQPEQQQQQQLMVMMEDEEEPAIVVQGRSKSGVDEEAPEIQPVNLRAAVEEEKDGKQEGVQRSVNDPAIAAVKPSGIALAGRGGVAASAPTGTAIVGKNGLALASPSATSVAGNFFDEDEDEEKKKPL
ncbi:uncharacterized protein LOC126562418 [Anopheles maculipalpis]|uniref:uncharacterized protein LOC126562418 n=1 Tax=Anopheles maculipalpis TaxID=1496333 RepID=UPI002158C7AD|nr:uncharacterized protein LOC126562418 [Anopheles maculipalpis]